MGEKAQRFPKVNALLFHNEGKDISTGIAGAKAMPALLLGVDEEGGVLFTVERA
ncbi:unnamed protein product, partial [marine sediment metagenome]